MAELTPNPDPIGGLAGAYERAQDLRLVRRCVAAASRVALDIGTNVTPDPDDPEGRPDAIQRARITFATRVLADPEGWGRKLAHAVVADPAVLELPQPDTLDDALIEGVIRRVWSVYAGVF